MKVLRPALVWGILIVLTVGSTLVAEKISSATVVVFAVFLVAAVKAELVITYYMEARMAESPWRTLYRAWVIVVALMLITGHLAV